MGVCRVRRRPTGSRSRSPLTLTCLPPMVTSAARGQRHPLRWLLSSLPCADCVHGEHVTRGRESPVAGSPWTRGVTFAVALHEPRPLWVELVTFCLGHSGQEEASTGVGPGGQDASHRRPASRRHRSAAADLREASRLLPPGLREAAPDCVFHELHNCGVRSCTKIEAERDQIVTAADPAARRHPRHAATAPRERLAH